jgi:hypothetical protein
MVFTGLIFLTAESDKLKKWIRIKLGIVWDYRARVILGLIFIRAFLAIKISYLGLHTWHLIQQIVIHCIIFIFIYVTVTELFTFLRKEFLFHSWKVF